MKKIQMQDFFQLFYIERYKIVSLLGSIATCMACCLQGQDAADLYLLDGSLSRDTFLVNRIQFLNDFNKGAYNNQPAFLDEHRILVTCQMAGAEQTDIWMLQPEEKIRTNLTLSRESEYSGAAVPGDGGFSCVRVESQPPGKQTLMHYFPGLPPRTVPVYNGPLQVGYYQWMDAQHLILFVLGGAEGRNELHMLDLGTGKTSLIAQNPGRCLRKTAEGLLAFVSKADSTYWFLKTFDPMTLQSSIIQKCPSGSEDFDQLTDGSWVMGQGSKIWSLAPGATQWKEVADLALAGIHKIGRLALWKRERLVLVNQY